MMGDWMERKAAKLDWWLLDNYLLHHIEVLTATQKNEVKGEFGITVTIGLLLAPAMMQMLMIVDPGVGSAMLCGLTVIFVALARRRQRLLARYLPLSSDVTCRNRP
ncbi:hypothetical protein [uncultured Sphingomonas sp.]|uniref:hypothetical protein n=1 Tax=uncultured Sphingomonas sp. TaxID=158754 RepID=UPI0035CB9CDB